jgi:hypothetical protein
VCIGKNRYNVKYDTVGFSDEHFVTLDAVTGLNKYLCNVDSTEIELTFDSDTDRINFINIISVPNEMFLIEGTKFNCQSDNTIIRHIMLIKTPIDKSVTLRVVPARYDEIFQDASVHVEKIGSCDATEHVCIGVNTVDCKNAYQDIPIYQNKYITIDCPSCFLGMSVDLFVDINIHLWHLEYLAGGFKNIQINGANIYQLNAHGSWSTGVDKTYTLVPPKTIIDIHIGIIPIKIWFDIPLHVLADASFVATANAKVGAIANWDIGSAYISWDPKNHWTHVDPNPKFTFTPVLSGDANFKGEVNIGLIPSINMHLDNLFDYSLIFSNTANFQVYGSGSIKPAEGQICAKADGEIKISGEAELHINVPFIHITDKTFGPYVYFDKQIQIFPEKCVKV